MDDLIKSARLEEDGTLWIELNDQDVVEDCKMIDKINRVIVTSGVWCKMFYVENKYDVKRNGRTSQCVYKASKQTHE